jgi:hypothetical protein
MNMYKNMNTNMYGTLNVYMNMYTNIYTNMYPHKHEIKSDMQINMHRTVPYGIWTIGHVYEHVHECVPVHLTGQDKDLTSRIGELGLSFCGISGSAVKELRKS